MRRLRLLFGLMALLCAWGPGVACAFDEDHNEVINGARLHFRVRGADKANPYLLILHGGPGFSAHMFYPWGPSLEKTVNVVYLDQRGSGESARLPVANPQDVQPSEVKDYTIANLVGDIEGVRQALHVDKWYVLGHSWGGMLGLEYVSAHPEHVRGYIHMDGLVSVPAMEQSLLDNTQAKFQALKTAGDPNAGALLAQVASLRALPTTDPARLFGGFGLAMGQAGLYFARDAATAFPAFLARTTEAVKPYNIPGANFVPSEAPQVGVIVNDHYLTRDDTPLLAKITVPTLIINGQQDGVIPPAQAEAVHRGIKSSELVLLADCGHFPFFEQPDKTAAAVLGFIGHTTLADGGQAAPLPRMTLPVMSVNWSDLRLQDFDVARLTSHDLHVTWKVDETGTASDVQISPPSGVATVDADITKFITGQHFIPATKDGKHVAVKMHHYFHIG